MTEVDDFSPRGLNEAPHDVDGGVVAVEQGRRRDDTNRTGARREHDLLVLGHAPSSEWMDPLVHQFKGGFWLLWPAGAPRRFGCTNEGDLSTVNLGAQMGDEHGT